MSTEMNETGIHETMKQQLPVELSTPDAAAAYSAADDDGDDDDCLATTTTNSTTTNSSPPTTIMDIDTTVESLSVLLSPSYDAFGSALNTPTNPEALDSNNSHNHNNNHNDPFAYKRQSRRTFHQTTTTTTTMTLVDSMYRQRNLYQ
jgi:hypothetical protein